MMFDPRDTHRQAELLSSLLLFTRVFFQLRTGKEFYISQPDGRESHYVTICRELTKVFYGETNKLIINIPPRYGKTELLIHFIAWVLARYPDSNFIYCSYAHSLAKKQTQIVRQILNLPAYRKVFGVELSSESSAKHDFETTALGSVYAAGAQGTITGRGAGITRCDRFAGAFIMDDMHKPEESLSDVIRENTINWFYNTAQSRTNDPKTPFIYIGQITHEDDLGMHLINTGKWKVCSLPALDEAGNALYPEKHTKQALLEMKELRPYEFAAQYQQNPQPAGGGIFKPEWLVILDDEPEEILSTFITCDTAETDKDYNDPTVFSFWGLYRIKEHGVYIDQYALHWLDCYEFRCEIKDLENEFRQFYSQCIHHKVRPQLAAIEKKSSGSTLLSLLNNFRGLEIIGINRTKASGSKASRFLEIQPYVAKKLISFTRGKKHTDMCIEHLRKITANDSHRFDDICDTLYDAVKIALIDKYIPLTSAANEEDKAIAQNIMSTFSRAKKIRNGMSWQL